MVPNTNLVMALIKWLTCGEPFKFLVYVYTDNRLRLQQVGGAHQFSFNDPHEDGVVVIHHLLALCGQTLIRDELAGLLQVPENLTLQSQK